MTCMPKGITLWHAPWLVDLYYAAKSNPRASVSGSIEYARLLCVAVEKELERMSELDRTLLTMRAEGYTQAETSAVVGMSVRSISRYVQRKVAA